MPRRPHILPRIDSGSGYAPLDHKVSRRSWIFSFGWKRLTSIVILILVGISLIALDRSRRERFFAHKKTTGGSQYPSTGSIDVDLPSSGDDSYPPIAPPPPAANSPPVDMDFEEVPEEFEEEFEDDMAPYPTTSVDAPSLPTYTAAPDAPNSPSNDPNPSGTTHCTSSSSSDKPLVQYALMIDAGSTGSRIHIYKFHNCLSSPTLEYEVFEQVRPGLSSYANKPLEAAKSLDELLDKAVKVVPEKLHSCTPVAVKATAGLRLLGAQESSDILDAVAQRLVSRYTFQLIEQDGVVVMEGKDEGVYAWITANYLLGTIGSSAMSTHPPYAVLDLGGASTQIVFEPRFSTPDSSLAEGDHKYTLQFSGQEHTLYQHSYLGYGLMRARRHVHNLVGFMWQFSKDEGKSAIEYEEIGNPCLAKGTRRTVELEVDEKLNVTMVGADVGSFEGCNRIVELVMAKDALCSVKPCSFNGVYQPSILDTFPSGGILTLSYFYDRINPLLPNNSSVPISAIATLATQVCEGPSSWATHFAHLPEETLDELVDRPEWCLDLTFMHALLRLGYEFHPEREVRLEKKVADVELGWCLGATLAMLDGDLQCRM